MIDKKGLIQVYTGNGKGKTTAAVGQGLRAHGHGCRVFMLQFMKGARNYGELLAISGYVPGFVIEQFGRDEFVRPGNPEQIDIDLARRGYLRAKEVIASGQYDMVILDEINVAVAFGLISVNEVLELLKNRSEFLDLVLTGRYASPELIAVADLVSDIQEVKHHYNAGVQARQGIEF